LVRPGVSTSTKIRPNALVVAGVDVPGTKKLMSAMLLFTGAKSLFGLKTCRSLGKPNRVEPVLLLTRKPVPGVL